MAILFLLLLIGVLVLFVPANNRYRFLSLDTLIAGAKDSSKRFPATITYGVLAATLCTFAAIFDIDDVLFIRAMANGQLKLHHPTS